MANGDIDGLRSIDLKSMLRMDLYLPYYVRAFKFEFYVHS
jgi:hypothetical protein